MSLAKAVVIVGAGPGVGLAVAKKFAKEGYSVALVARSKEKLQNYQKEVAGSHIFTADAGNAESLKSALDDIKKSLGVPEVVIYNAALMERRRLDETDITKFSESLNINVVGALIAAQHYLPEFKAAKKGTIILTGGGLAFGPRPGLNSGALAIGKSAVRSLTQSLFNELKPEGIHVATVTICGMVKPGTLYDPEAIAQDYWKLHAEKESEWTNEIVFKKE